MTPVEMPKANENLVEATLDHWLVKEGDQVAKDQSLCVIITDKATFEMPAPESGTVLKILAPGRAVLPVGYVMCVLGQSGEAVPENLAARNEALVAAHRGASMSMGPSSTAAPGGGSLAVGSAAVPGGAGVRATPAARRLAKEAGVDLASVAAALKLTGPVNEKDIKAFLEQR